MKFSRYEFTVAYRFAFPRSVRAAGAERSKPSGWAWQPSVVSVIAVAGMTLSTAALILTLSIVRGFSQEIESKLIGFGAHFSITHLGGDLFAEQPEKANALRDQPEIAGVSPYLQREIILRTTRRTADSLTEVLLEPALLKGIEVQTDISFLEKKIVAGHYFLPEPDSGNSFLPLVIGKRLLTRLGAAVGDTVFIIASEKSLKTVKRKGQAGSAQAEKLQAQAGEDADGQTVQDYMGAMRLGEGVVTGVYETGLGQDFDGSVVITSLPMLRKFLRVEKKISGYEAKVEPLEKLKETAAEAGKAFGFPLAARTVYETYRPVFSWLKLQENIIPLLLVTVAVVAGFNIVSTLLIIVLEKSREIGILMSFGSGRGSIRTVFVSQAALMALVGIAIGNIVALSLSLLEKNIGIIPLSEETYFTSRVPIAIDPAHYLLVSVIGITICLIASLVPASLAARLKPVEAIRF